MNQNITIEKQLRKYIIPNVFSMMGVSLYILADTFFISMARGVDGITALNLVLPIYSLIYALGAMIGIGSATRYSLDRALGKTDAGDYFSNAVLWSLIISLLFVIAGVFGSGDILQILGADTKILQVGSEYLKIAMCFAPCFMLNYTMTSFVRNDGEPKIAMAATVSSSLFNIVFDYILMFPLGMGMRGAALATGLSPIVSMLICMTHYLSKKNTMHFRLMVPSIKRLFKASSLGIVAFIGELASGITTLAFNYILLHLAGNIAVAAYGVIANIALVGTSIFNGVSQGLQPLASKAHGAGEWEQERRIQKHSMVIGMLLAIALVTIVWVGAELFVAAFNSEHSNVLERYAVYGIRIYFIGFIMASLNMIQAGYLSAAGYAVESMLISLARGMIVIIIMAFVLSYFWGIIGVWMAFPASEAVTMVISIWMQKQVRKNAVFSKTR